MQCAHLLLQARQHLLSQPGDHVLFHGFLEHDPEVLEVGLQLAPLLPDAAQYLGVFLAFQLPAQLFELCAQLVESLAELTVEVT